MDMFPVTNKAWIVRVPAPEGNCLGCKRDYSTLNNQEELYQCHNSEDFVCGICIDDFEWDCKIGEYIRKEKND